MPETKSDFEKILDEIVAEKLAEIDKITKANIKQKLRDRHKLPLFKTERFNHWPYY